MTNDEDLIKRASVRALTVLCSVICVWFTVTVIVTGTVTVSLVGLTLSCNLISNNSSDSK